MSRGIRKEDKEEASGTGPGVSSLQPLVHPRSLTSWAARAGVRLCPGSPLAEITFGHLLGLFICNDIYVCLIPIQKGLEI